MFAINRLQFCNSLTVSALSAEKVVLAFGAKLNTVIILHLSIIFIINFAAEKSVPSVEILSSSSSSRSEYKSPSISSSPPASSE